MRKEQYTTVVVGDKNHSSIVKKNESWANKFVQWFHDFLESAE